MYLHTNQYEIRLADGAIRRKDGKWNFSPAWLCTGAVKITRFGQISQSLNLRQLAEIVRQDKASLFYKNGKPRFYLTDLDHGTHRIQCDPHVKSLWLSTEVSQ